MTSPQRLDPVDRMMAAAYAGSTARDGLDRSVFSPAGPATVFVMADGRPLAEGDQSLIEHPQLVVSSIVVAADGFAGRMTAVGSVERLFIGRVFEDTFVVMHITDADELAGLLGEQCAGLWLRDADETKRTISAWVAGVTVAEDVVIAGADLSAYPPEPETLDDFDLGDAAVAEVASALFPVLAGRSEGCLRTPVHPDADLQAVLSRSEDLFRVAEHAAVELTFVSELFAATIISGPGGTLVLVGPEDGQEIVESDRGLLGELAALISEVRTRQRWETDSRLVLPAGIWLREWGAPSEEPVLFAELEVTATGSVVVAVTEQEPHASPAVVDDRAPLRAVAVELLEIARRALLDFQSVDAPGSVQG